MSFSDRVISLCLLVLFVGCESKSSGPAPGDPYDYGGYGDYGYGDQEIKFLADAPANADIEVGLSDLTLTTVAGDTTRVRELSGTNGAVVVVTRGNTNPICPYCSTQTAHYIRDHDEFSRRGVAVIVVYPIETRSEPERLEAFLTDARSRVDDSQRPVPFPVLFDVELTAVDQLGIRKDLSKPATYILDAAGEVTYAYVGAHLGDRPAVAAVLAELDKRGFTGDSSGPGSDPGSDAPDAVDPAGVETPSGAAVEPST